MRNHWYYRRYRPNAFIHGQRGTCRRCNEPINFIFETGYYDATKRTVGVWIHEGVQDGDEAWQAQDHYPQPKEFCCETVTSQDYDDCGSPVKYEDINAGNYSCGRHMRKFLDDKAYHQRLEEQTAKRKERDALEEFEAEQYQAAATWIRDNGFESLIEKDYEAKPHYDRLHRTTKVDVFRLYEFLMGVVEKLAELPEDGWIPPDVLEMIANRPPPPWVGDRP